MQAFLKLVRPIFEHDDQIWIAVLLRKKKKVKKTKHFAVLFLIAYSLFSKMKPVWRFKQKLALMELEYVNDNSAMIMNKLSFH